MQEEKQEKLPIDAELLSDAIVELNISRRSIGLYPPDHPVIKESIARAFDYLQRLFELRVEITLGVAMDSLVVDENTINRKNPFLKEFARSLHNRGIAAIKFHLGLTKDELIRFHELLTMRELITGSALVEYATSRNIRHIILIPIDFAGFRFVEGAAKADTKVDTIWQDYVSNLLLGRLSDDEEDVISSIPPEELAGLINASMPEATETTAYDSVIKVYLKKKNEPGLSTESFNKFFSLMFSLKPELRKNFMSKAIEHADIKSSDVEKLLRRTTPANLQKMVELFTENSAMLQGTFKGLLDKLASIKMDTEFNFDLYDQNSAIVHDIEIGEDIKKLFDVDNFKIYVSESYQQELQKMLESSPESRVEIKNLRKECRDEVIDRAALGALLELFETDFITTEDTQRLVNRVLELTDIFIETCRFREILQICDTLSSPALKQKLGDDTSGMIEAFFTSEKFVNEFISSLRLWGRKDRDSAFGLAKVLGAKVIDPLLDALIEEADASIRKFLLSMLVSLGSDIIPYVTKRLNDDQWYIVRNMLYLLRECDGNSHIAVVRKFTKDKNLILRIEALKTLLHFQTNDSLSCLELYLQSKNETLRRGAVRLAGIYRITEVTPHLIKLLEKKDLFGAEAFYKHDIVRVLGEIGDTRAIAPLMKICKAKALFYRDNLQRLKVEIFKSLGGYPFESIRPLIEFGLKSKNQQIHTITEQLMDKNPESSGRRGS